MSALGAKEEWPVGQLGDLCEISIGRTPARARRDYWGPGSPWLSIADMSQGRDLDSTTETITDVAVRECNCRLVSAGTVLLSFKLSVGKVGITKRPMFTNEAIAALPIKDASKILPNFLYWSLRSIDLTLGLDRAAKGLTLNSNKLHLIRIPLPPLPEQRRIAEILDKADALRVKRRAALAQLDTLTQSIFLDMFGDPATNPKGWPVKPLGGAFELKHGFAFKSEQFVPDGEFALLTPGNFFEKGGFRGRGEKQRYHNEPVPQEYVLDQGDLLIAMTEQAPGLLGSPILVPESRRFLHNQRLGKVVKKVEIDSLFIFELMNAPSIRARIQRDSTGTKVKHTSPKKIAAIKVGIPPIDLQHRFTAFVDSVEQQKTSQRAHLAEIHALFASLQHRAFRGAL